MAFRTAVTGADACVGPCWGNPTVQWVGPKERCTPRKHYTEETETLHSSFLPLTQTMNWCVDRFQNGPGDGGPEVGVGRKYLGPRTSGVR